MVYVNQKRIINQPKFRGDLKMEKMEVSAKTSEGLEGTITIDVPSTLKEAIELYGEEAILSNALANGKVVIQSGIRNGLRAGRKISEIQEQYKNWKLGTTVRGGGTVDPLQKALAAFMSKTPEEQAKFIAELKAKAQK
jgi:hypothetical protein